MQEHSEDSGNTNILASHNLTSSKDATCVAPSYVYQDNLTPASWLFLKQKGKLKTLSSQYHDVKWKDD